MVSCVSVDNGNGLTCGLYNETRNAAGMLHFVVREVVLTGVKYKEK